MSLPESSALPGWPRPWSPPVRHSSVPPHRRRAREARPGRPPPQSQPAAFVLQRGRCQCDTDLQGRCSVPDGATQTAWENPVITKTQGKNMKCETFKYHLYGQILFLKNPSPWEEVVLWRLLTSLRYWFSAPTRKRPTKEESLGRYFRQQFLVLKKKHLRLVNYTFCPLSRLTSSISGSPTSSHQSSLLKCQQVPANTHLKEIRKMLNQGYTIKCVK